MTISQDDIARDLPVGQAVPDMDNQPPVSVRHSLTYGELSRKRLSLLPRPQSLAPNPSPLIPRP